MRRRGFPWIVTAALLAVGTLLAGCSSDRGRPAPPGPTDAQVSAYMAAWAQQQASIVGGHFLGGAPSVQFEAFVPDSRRIAVLSRCVAQRGGSPAGARLRTQSGSSSAALQVDRTVYAGMVCDIEYPPASLRSQLRTGPQLDYEYSYYRSTLVPCLQAHGMTVVGMPDAAGFRRFGGNGLTAWRPYEALRAVVSPAPPRSVLQAECPAEPPGIDS